MWPRDTVCSSRCQKWKRWPCWKVKIDWIIQLESGLCRWHVVSVRCDLPGYVDRSAGNLVQKDTKKTAKVVFRLRGNATLRTHQSSYKWWLVGFAASLTLGRAVAEYETQAMIKKSCMLSRRKIRAWNKSYTIDTTTYWRNFYALNTVLYVSKRIVYFTNSYSGLCNPLNLSSEASYCKPEIR